MSVSTEEMQHIVNDMYVLLESYIKNTQGYYIDNPDAVLSALIKAVDTVQPGTMVNKCIVCGIDIGEDNPRQYCAKTYCAEYERI